MSLLAAMKQKKKERLTVKHPLYQRDISVRYAYVMGVALVTATGGRISETERTELEKLVYAIGLPEDTLDKVIATAEAAAAESIDTVVDTILEKEEQYCLLLEMHLAALRSGAEQQKEQQELICGFRELMLLSAAEGEFLRNFSQAVLEKNVRMATDGLTEGYRNNLEPNFEVLKYFLPTLDYREEIEGFTLEAGQSRSITRPCIVKGPIVIKRGGELIITGSDVFFENGWINCVGGIFQSTNSKFSVGEKYQEYIVYANEGAKVVFDNVIVDGANYIGGIAINSGFLNAKNCKFQKCYTPSFGGAIFSRDILEVSNCIFEKCKSKIGGAIYFIEGKIKVNQCSFLECTSGAAVLIENANVELANSSFSMCNSDLEGIVIFRRCKGTVIENVCEECSVYDEKTSFPAIFYGEDGNDRYFTPVRCKYINCNAKFDESLGLGIIPQD